MKKLFIFQSSKSEYSEQLVAGHMILSESMKINIDELTIEYVLKNVINVVISNGLPVEWYYIFKGLRIVVITLDNAEQYSDLADIVIDFKSSDNGRYLTGANYSLFGEGAKVFDEITNLITILKWDTEFFGYPIAYLSSKYLTDSIMHQIETFNANNNTRLIEYLCNCHDRLSVFTAEKNGFHFADIRLTFERKLEVTTFPALHEDVTYGLAETEHVPELRLLSNNIYRDSRYFFDAKFDVDKVNEFYCNWVEKAVKGTFDDECHALFMGRRPVAFCTIRYIDKTSAQIGLVGVNSEFRGMGLAKRLLRCVFATLSRKEITSVIVVTQGRNYTAQRLYQNAGFITKTTELWYHKWL